MLTQNQKSAFKRALAACDVCEQKLQYLEQLSAVSPELAKAVADFKTRWEYIKHLSSTALILDENMKKLA